MTNTTNIETTVKNTVMEGNQFKILGIWAAAAVPMGILAYVLYPALDIYRFATWWAGLGFCERPYWKRLPFNGWSLGSYLLVVLYTVDTGNLWWRLMSYVGEFIFFR